LEKKKAIKEERKKRRESIRERMKDEDEIGSDSRDSFNIEKNRMREKNANNYVILLQYYYEIVAANLKLNFSVF
jgi:hypothetical protein